MKLTKDQQIEALKMLTPEWAIQRSPRVAGGKPWTAHEYVTHMLDSIFEPDNWDFEITGELRTVELPGSELLLSVPGKLTVRFADGTVAIRSDVGTGSVHRLKDESDLSKTPVENFETGMKDAVTSALKGCARDLGRIFVPMQSDLVANLIRRNVFEAELGNLLPQPSGEELQSRLEKNKRALGRDNGDLLAAPEREQDHAPIEADVTQAPSTPAPQAEDVRKHAQIKSGAWFERAKKLAARMPYYQDKNGEANLYHMAGAVLKCGYQEITDENLDAAIRDLAQHAREQAQEVPQ